MCSRGLHEVIPQELPLIFDAEELGYLICGAQETSPDARTMVSSNLFRAEQEVFATLGIEQESFYDRRSGHRDKLTCDFSQRLQTFQPPPKIVTATSCQPRWMLWPMKIVRAQMQATSAAALPSWLT